MKSISKDSKHSNKIIDNHQDNNQLINIDPDCPDQEAMKENGKERSVIRKTGKYDEGRCAICLVFPQIDACYPSCGHTFCNECLVQWYKIKKECPTCKQVIKKLEYVEDDEDIYLRRSTLVTMIKIALNDTNTISFDGNGELFAWKIHIQRKNIEPKYYQPINNLKAKRAILIESIKHLSSQNQLFKNRYELRNLLQQVLSMDVKIDNLMIKLTQINR